MIDVLSSELSRITQYKQIRVQKWKKRVKYLKHNVITILIKEMGPSSDTTLGN